MSMLQMRHRPRLPLKLLSGQPPQLHTVGVVVSRKETNCRQSLDTSTTGHRW